MIDEGALTLFLLITARMSGFVLFNPLLSRQNFPGTLRAGFTLLLSVFTYSVTGGRLEPPAGMLPFAGAILLEMAIGFAPVSFTHLTLPASLRVWQVGGIGAVWAQ